MHYFVRMSPPDWLNQWGTIISQVSLGKCIMRGCSLQARRDLGHTLCYTCHGKVANYNKNIADLANSAMNDVRHVHTNRGCGFWNKILAMAPKI